MDYETELNAYKFEWWALILCALIGALNVLHWLRCTVVKFMKNVSPGRMSMARSGRSKSQKNEGQDTTKKFK